MTSDERTVAGCRCAARVLMRGSLRMIGGGGDAAPAHPCRCHGNDAQPATYGRPRHTLTYQTTHAHTCTPTQHIYVDMYM